jgi:large subunit ribosomal protein L10
MKKKQKELIINSLSNSFSLSKSFYIVDPSGLTVCDVNLIRRQCFISNVEYRVAKNTFISQALRLSQGEFDYSECQEILKGASGVFFLSEDASSLPAKLIKDFRKQKSSSKFLLKCAFIDGEIYLGEDHLNMLSALKSKKELIGDVISSLKSSTEKIISALTNYDSRS